MKLWRFPASNGDPDLQGVDIRYAENADYRLLPGDGEMKKYLWMWDMILLLYGLGCNKVYTFLDTNFHSTVEET